MFDGLGLFLGALGDALIGPNLFVPGEPFFIAAGFQLYSGAWMALVLVMLGGLLGDQLSYFIGYKYGAKAQRRLIKFRPKTKRLIARCRYLVAHKGTYIILFARLLGPIAWVVPFIAGSHRVQWRNFSALAVIGLALGGGQFVAWGMLLAHGVENFPWLNSLKIFISEHHSLIVGVFAVLVFTIIGYRMKWRRLVLKSSALLLAWVLFANYAHFFWKADDFQNQPETAQINKVDWNSVTYKAFPGKSSFYSAQAINVIYVGATPRDLMKQLGWIENQTFSRNEIEWAGYLALLRDKTPPVSDLYWRDKPQDMAFQLPGNLMKRSHIRWWRAGVDIKTNQPQWLGAISYDDGLKVTPYSGIVTVLHNIDPNVDEERDRLANQIRMSLPDIELDKYPLATVEVINEDHDYYTDGRILMIGSTTLSDDSQVLDVAVNDI
ncbi:membrane-associated protein [Vibrio crassostreae]|uniref:LssY C-terminal domain-containing protein n=1 Tax=Vibrio crassostreae TaxID=246167 RepID=UPI001B306ACA|nr:LssY C-terminal domain-containing protein [Vibrio crassostreae]CAK1867807.1 membrane-associated protein [Vibrio crassostreae]CAK1872291.1 membrane-associated protein [Vibrio crassostreae]CAK1881509.1 membrane-associated protein [Vibrio crassostreae]CAK1883844.1 membrane-associated protein [Vibrio crassostreae]CAK1936269.1 membrane-associated protein [Vibrio crassostreae]